MIISIISYSATSSQLFLPCSLYGSYEWNVCPLHGVNVIISIVCDVIKIPAGKPPAHPLNMTLGVFNHIILTYAATASMSSKAQIHHVWWSCFFHRHQCSVWWLNIKNIELCNHATHQEVAMVVVKFPSYVPISSTWLTSDLLWHMVNL